jgi:hypothetical protein
MNGGGEGVSEKERFENKINTCSHQGSIWAMEVELHSFLPSELDGGEWST